MVLLPKQNELPHEHLSLVTTRNPCAIHAAAGLPEIGKQPCRTHQKGEWPHWLGVTDFGAVLPSIVVLRLSHNGNFSQRCR